MKRPDITRAQLAAVVSAAVAVLAAFHWDSGSDARSVVYSAAALAAVWIGGDAHIRGRRALAAGMAGDLLPLRHEHLDDASGATSATSSGGPAKTA
jgi:hypothetical protein